MRNKPRYRISQAILALGGVEQTRVALQMHGFVAPDSRTIAGWRRRNSASGWELAIVYCLVKEGLLNNLDNLIVREAA